VRERGGERSKEKRGDREREGVKMREKNREGES
jgi:hypothetical protein